MKLRELSNKVTRIFNQQLEEARVFQTVRKPEFDVGEKDSAPSSPNIIMDEYNRAFGFVKKALAENKHLLGVYPQDDEKKLPEAEVEKRDIERFILKVRWDLREHIPKQKFDLEVQFDDSETCDRIIFQVLTEISSALIGQKFGTVFSETEATMFKEQFPERFPKKPKPQPNNEPWQRSIHLKNLQAHGEKVREEAAKEGQQRLAEKQKPSVHAQRPRLNTPPPRGNTPRPPIQIPLPPAQPPQPPAQIPQPPAQTPPPLAAQAPPSLTIKPLKRSPLEERTLKEMEKRRKAAMAKMSPEDRARLQELEDRLRREGKIL